VKKRRTFGGVFKLGERGEFAADMRLMMLLALRMGEDGRAFSAA